MFRFWKIEPEHLLLLLRSGKLDEDIDELFQQFWALSTLVQYELIKYIKEKGVNPSSEVVSSVFKVDRNTALSFLRSSKVREFLIPVAGKQRGELVRAIGVGSTEDIITNQPHLENSLREVSKLVGSGFGFFCEANIQGESFTLPLAVHLTVENIPKDLIFTGKVDKEGRIYDVDGLPKKRKAAKERGYRLVEPFHFENIKEIKNWLDADEYHIPFYITKTSSNYEGELKDFLSSSLIENPEGVLRCLEILSGIPRSKLIMTTGQLPQDKEAWEKTIEEFFIRLKEIESALGGREILHIAINGPATLAFAVGSLFGSQKPFVFYHKQGAGYAPIEVKNVRALKERVKDYKLIDWKLDLNSDELAIAFALAHHELEASVKEFMKEKNPSLLVIRHKKEGNIPVEDMLETAKECASVIQDVRMEREFKAFHIFLSIPVAVAFMVGVAFGYYSGGYIYQHIGGGQYFLAVDLNNIRSVREGLNAFPR